MNNALGPMPSCGRREALRILAERAQAERETFAWAAPVRNGSVRRRTRPRPEPPLWIAVLLLGALAWAWATLMFAM